MGAEPSLLYSRSVCGLVLLALAGLFVSILRTPVQCDSLAASNQACIAAHSSLQSSSLHVENWRPEPSEDHAREKRASSDDENLPVNAFGKISFKTECLWTDPVPGRLNHLVFAEGDERNYFTNLQEALNACADEAACKGVCGELLAIRNNYKLLFSLHSSDDISSGERGEMTYLQKCREVPVEENLGPLIPEQKLKRWTPRHENPGLVGYKIRGLDTILIHVASYRDQMCSATIANAFRRAAHPDRVYVAVVDQSLSIDTPCVPQQVDCHSGNLKADSDWAVLCKNLRQIRVHRLDARLARGPTFGRNRADQMYKGETFLLQIDAHMLFTQNWDNSLIRQWESLDDEYGILTAYPTQAVGGINSTSGKRLRPTSPVMCHSRIMLPQGLVRFENSLEMSEHDNRLPTVHPFFAAGLSFSRGHRILNVPYDCCTPWIFMGEEFIMAARLYTHGYTAYSFLRTALVHFYPFERPQHTAPLFWENNRDEKHHDELAASSMARIRHILGLHVDPIKEPFSTRAVSKFSLGRVRPIQEFFDMFRAKISVDGSKIIAIDSDALCSYILNKDGAEDTSQNGKERSRDESEDGDHDEEEEVYEDHVLNNSGLENSIDEGEADDHNEEEEVYEEHDLIDIDLGDLDNVEDDDNLEIRNEPPLDVSANKVIGNANVRIMDDRGIQEHDPITDHLEENEAQSGDETSSTKFQSETKSDSQSIVTDTDNNSNGIERTLDSEDDEDSTSIVDDTEIETVLDDESDIGQDPHFADADTVDFNNEFESSKASETISSVSRMNDDIDRIKNSNDQDVYDEDLDLDEDEDEEEEEEDDDDDDYSDDDNYDEDGKDDSYDQMDQDILESDEDESFKSVIDETEIGKVSESDENDDDDNNNEDSYDRMDEDSLQSDEDEDFKSAIDEAEIRKISESKDDDDDDEEEDTYSGNNTLFVLNVNSSIENDASHDDAILNGEASLIEQQEHNAEGEQSEHIHPTSQEHSREPAIFRKKNGLTRTEDEQNVPVEHENEVTDVSKSGENVKYSVPHGDGSKASSPTDEECEALDEVNNGSSHELNGELQDPPNIRDQKMENENADDYSDDDYDDEYDDDEDLYDDFEDNLPMNERSE